MRRIIKEKPETEEIPINEVNFTAEKYYGFINGKGEKGLISQNYFTKNFTVLKATDINKPKTDLVAGVSFCSVKNSVKYLMAWRCEVYQFDSIAELFGWLVEHI